MLLPYHSAEAALIEVIDNFLINKLNGLFSEVVFPHPTQEFNIIIFLSKSSLLFSQQLIYSFFTVFQSM